jgi:tRNA threonylcarbamoyladenosine biosynthesis protein TsaB
LRVLAIDTALDQCAVALWDHASKGVLAEQTIPMQRGHAEALLPMIEKVMAQAGLAYTAINRLVVTTGPGSFTGLRIGISAARGLALALGVPAVGVSTLSAYAAPYSAAAQPQPVAVVLDAKNDQAYLQEFDESGQALSPPAALAVAEVAKRLQQKTLILAGTAAERVYVSAKVLGKEVHLAPDGSRPHIGMIARLGALEDPTLSPARPLYIRMPSTSISSQPSIAMV